MTRGAEASHLSLSAASTRVRNLEDAIGTKLLYRTSQGVTPTPPGKALVHHARSVIAQLDLLRGDLQEYIKGIKGHLRMFANTTAMEFLPPLVRAYLVAHPDVNIDLRQKPSHSTVRCIADGSADIGIVAGDVRTETLEFVPWRRDRLVLVVGASHPLAAEGAVDFGASLGYSHVGQLEASAITVFLNKACEAMNRRMSLRIQVADFESACRMIEAGVGIGVVPGSTARRHAQYMDIRIVGLTDTWAERAELICMRRFDALPTYARELVDMLVADDSETIADASPVSISRRMGSACS